MMIRRQLEMEHSRREQEMARRMQEATSRETRLGPKVNDQKKKCSDTFCYQQASQKVLLVYGSMINPRYMRRGLR